MKNRVAAIIEEISAGTYERERELSLSLLTAIAGESIFLLGKPGVAKSLVARRLKCAFAESRQFEYLMSRFSTPDEIFGPVKISMLKDHDTYERATSGYLPEADVAFLDEIWKAGPSIQNALLTIINEKVFRNGEKEAAVPLKALIAASNELPAEDEGLEALWDRFLVRLVVEGIHDRVAFEKMIAGTAGVGDTLSVSKPITVGEYYRWQKGIAAVEVGRAAFDVIHAIRLSIAAYNENRAEKEQIYISDRRWKKIVHLMKASAFVNDSCTIGLADCWLIGHCLWNNEEQILAARQMVNEAIERECLKNISSGRSVGDRIDRLKKEVDDGTHYTEVAPVAKFTKDFESKPVASDGDWLTMSVTRDNLECLEETSPERPMQIAATVISVSNPKKKCDGQATAYISEGNKLVVKCLDFDTQACIFTSRQISVMQKEFSGIHYIKAEIETREVRRYAPATEAQCRQWDAAAGQITDVVARSKERLAEFCNGELVEMVSSLFVSTDSVDALKRKVQSLEVELNGYLQSLDEIRQIYNGR